MAERDEDGRLVQYRGPADSPDCVRCPCARNGRPVKTVRAFGATGGLMCVGEAPATEELFQGYPFVGPSGREMNNIFRRGNIDRQLLWVTNALLCPRPKDDSQMARAIDCCRPRLREEMALVKPTAVIALGGTAARSLQLLTTTITDARGTVQESPLVPGVPVVTTIHPAALFKGGAGEVSGGKNKQNVDAQLLFLQADVEKAYHISTGELSSKWADDIMVVSEPADCDAAMTAILADAREWGLLGLDLEWDQHRNITWCGLGTKKRAFAFLWSALVQTDALDVVRDVMADATLPKLIHNKQADKGVWEGGDVLLDPTVKLWNTRVGPMRGVLEDSMLLHHAAFPGIAHDLQNVVSQFLVVPPWKTWRATEVAEGIKKAKEDAKAEIKAAKRVVHETRNAERAAEAEVKRAGKLAAKEAKVAEKTAKQIEHEAENARRKAEAEAKKAARKIEHEARNAASQTAAVEGRRAVKKPNDVADNSAVPVSLAAAAAAQPVPEYVGVCPQCRAPQKNTESGVRCTNGHRAEPVSEPILGPQPSMSPPAENHTSVAPAAVDFDAAPPAPPAGLLASMLARRAQVPASLPPPPPVIEASVAVVDQQARAEEAALESHVKSQQSTAGHGPEAVPAPPNGIKRRRRIKLEVPSSMEITPEMLEEFDVVRRD